MATRKRPAAKQRAVRRTVRKAAARKPARKAAAKRPARKAAAKQPSRKAVRKAPRKAAGKGAGTPAAPARKAARKAPRKAGYVAKTRATSQNVGQFLAGIADAAKRADAEEIARMLGEITGVEARMWGPSIVGFGEYHYRYESGHEGDMCVAGFSPRKDALTLYVMPGFERHGDLMAKLGKYRTGKSCLYVKRLDDVDRNVLRELLEKSVAIMAPKRTA